ncbi:MAG: SDR family NAD(P)-dependent oxidoreductase [Roseburia sp.]|nr:SDR family NAD(P)-dependent oxidoreductase [Roseburia sp.]MCM1096647.1 SDR family NAD(P)-dependent oxidoreductase [Ruminococcus flavefaciens]
MNILISGADRGLGFGMTKLLLERGHIVFAGRYLKDWKELEGLKARYRNRLQIIELDVSSDDSVRKAGEAVREQTDCLDMLISNAGINGKLDGEVVMESDYGYMMRTYNVNSLGAVRLVEIFYQMMRGSDIRRMCFVSSEAGSITQAQRTDNFSYCMSKAALNMYVKLIGNRLKPEGYSFRLYHPGWIRSYMGGKLSEKGNLSIEEAAEYAVNYFLDESVDETELAMYGYDGEKFKF